MNDERRLAVLRAIVEDYVQSQEPVGSRALVERHHLGVSPATIRNDMAVLEEQGYIAQPHTSAGRVPTDKGYRLFVDRLSTIKPLSAADIGLTADSRSTNSRYPLSVGIRPALVCGWVMNPCSSSTAMSLRIVAGETSRPCLSTRDFDPTGSVVDT